MSNSSLKNNLLKVEILLYASKTSNQYDLICVKRAYFMEYRIILEYTRVY